MNKHVREFFKSDKVLTFKPLRPGKGYTLNSSPRKKTETLIEYKLRLNKLYGKFAE